jgi:hypothetical protein
MAPTRGPARRRAGCTTGTGESASSKYHQRLPSNLAASGPLGLRGRRRLLQRSGFLGVLRPRPPLPGGLRVVGGQLLRREGPRYWSEAVDRLRGLRVVRPVHVPPRVEVQLCEDRIGYPSLLPPEFDS